MTAEELQNLHYTETDFIKALALLVYQEIKDYKLNEKPVLMNTGFRKYILRVNEDVDRITTSVDDLKMIKSFVLSHKPKSHLDPQQDSANQLRCHYDNAIMRVYRVKDQILSLINRVLNLNLEKGLNLEKEVIRDLTERYSGFATIWNSLKDPFDYFKSARNHIVHRGSIGNENLDLLNVFYNFGISKTLSELEAVKYKIWMTSIQSNLVKDMEMRIDIYIDNIERVATVVFLILAEPFLARSEQFAENPHS